MHQLNDFFLWLYLSISAVLNNLYSLIVSTWDMTDEKSLVKMNKMIHKKTGASFLVVCVIYVSLVYTDSKKTMLCLLPRHTIFATFGRQLKCLLLHIQGSLYLFHYVLDNLNWLPFVFLSNLIINLMLV